MKTALRLFLSHYILCNAKLSASVIETEWISCSILSLILFLVLLNVCLFLGFHRARKCSALNSMLNLMMYSISGYYWHFGIVYLCVTFDRRIDYVRLMINVFTAVYNFPVSLNQRLIFSSPNKTDLFDTLPGYNHYIDYQFLICSCFASSPALKTFSCPW